MTKLTPFGVELRKLRVDKDMRLLDLAAKLDQSTAFVSAIETGRKQIPDGYLHKISQAMNLSAEEIRRLRGAAEKTRKEVRVDNLRGEQRELVAAFARKLDDVPSDLMEALKKIVLKSSGGEAPFYRRRRGIVVPPMSTGKLRIFAEKIRDVFVPDSEIEFTIMDVLEFKMSKIMPDFFIDIGTKEEMGDDEGRVLAGSNSIIFREDVYEGACNGNRRDRFTACHEFAHFLMHRDVKFARSREDTDKIYTDSEWQADEFAGTLMLSARHIHLFADADAAAEGCNMNPVAARVMWSKYAKEGKIK